jgi:hypothetical protein
MGLSYMLIFLKSRKSLDGRGFSKSDPRKILSRKALNQNLDFKEVIALSGSTLYCSWSG